MTQNTPPTQDTGEMLKYTQRLLAWSTYQDSLRDSDQEILRQFQATHASLRASLWARLFIYFVQIGVVTATFYVSASQSGGMFNWPGAVSLVSLLLLGILIYRNPLKAINRTLVDLTRVNIILQGYQRQINQVDATFKQEFLENRFDEETLKRSLEQIQHIIDRNVESLMQFLEEML